MALQCSAGMAFSPLSILDTKDGGTQMHLASAIARPRSCSAQDFRFMDGIVLPNGQCLQVPIGKFAYRGISLNIPAMQTIDKTRRIRLEMLIKMHGGKLANLNEALGYERTASKLARIRNRNARSDRPGKFFEMGDEQAREIEAALKLENGWMDTPPGYDELLGEEDPRTKVMQLMEDMPPDQWATVVRLVDAIAQPSLKTGTNDKQ